MSVASRAKPATVVLLLSLYLAQGLPVGFMTQALPALLRHYGVSLAQIGIAGLLMAPWAIKFLWAAWVDRQPLPLQGHYRGWIVVMQLGTLACLLGLAWLPVQAHLSESSLWLMAGLLLIMNTCCATQDIATDGLAVNVLHRDQLHWGNSVQVIGSRLGFIVGGGAVLYAIDMLSWRSSFLLLAAAVALTSISIWLYREPAFAHHQRVVEPMPQQVAVRQNWPDKIRQHYGYLWSTPELRLWLAVLATHKLADGLAGPIVKPMMLDMGLTLADIGLYVTVIGATCALLGAWVAVLIIRHWLLPRAMLGLALLQTLALIYYGVLAYQFQHHQPFGLWHLYIANALEETLGSMTLVALLSIVMQYARAEHAGHDFTLQVAVMTMVSGGLYLVGGALAQWLGYWQFFCLIMLLSILSCYPKWLWYRHQRQFD